VVLLVLPRVVLVLALLVVELVSRVVVVRELCPEPAGLGPEQPATVKVVQTQTVTAQTQPLHRRAHDR
jgi:hypothetical protein